MNLLLMQWLNLLNTPFARPKWNNRNLLWLVLISLSCSFFIILFKPFGIQNTNGQWYYDLIIISMGAVFILSYLTIEWGVPRVLPKIFTNWTLGKAILWYALVMLFIGAFMFWYKSYLAGYTDFTLKEYFFVIGRTLLIVLTVSFFSLGLYQYFSRRTISLFTTNEQYIITANNGKTLRINPNDILYISSDDNYVDIHYLNDGMRKKIVFRSSLKNIESQLVNLISPISRCHRQYLININRFDIQKMTSRKMLVVLRKYEDEIPVSKKYVDVIKQQLFVRH